MKATILFASMLTMSVSSEALAQSATNPRDEIDGKFGHGRSVVTISRWRLAPVKASSTPSADMC
jgi:hypothetical protein